MFDGTAGEPPKLEPSPYSELLRFSSNVGKSTPCDSKSFATACWILNAVRVVAQVGLPPSATQLGAGRGALARIFLYA